MFSTQQYFGFDPRTIPGCTLWLDGADTNTLFSDSGGTTLATVGGTIGYWKDKSGVGRHYTQTTAANRPLYDAIGSVTFNTTAHFLTYSGTWTTGGWDVFTVSTPLVSTATWRTMWRGFTTDHPTLIESGSTRLGYFHNASLGFQQFGSLTFAGGTRRLLYVSISSGRAYSAALDGTVTTSAAGGTGTADTQMFYSLGSAAAGLQPWGTINEVIIVPNTTLAQRQQIEGYLAWKWGLQTNLPTGHPFRPNPTTMRIFQPNDITGLEFWFDAADTSRITTSPSFVWSNKGSTSGSNITVFSGTPISGTVTQNGRNLVSLSNGTQLIFTGAFPTQTRTRFIATRPTSSSETSLFYQNRSSTSGNDYLGVGTTMFEVAQGIVVTMQSAAISSQSNVFSIYTFMNASTSGSNRIAINGSNLTLTTSVAAGSYNTASATNYINHTNSQDLGEWISYNRQLTTAEIAQVEGYLAAKWGLSGSLPTTQPYYLQQALPSTPLFVPTSLSNCNLWLDAMDTSTFTPANPADGTGITAWSDKSGSNYTFSRTFGSTNATYNAASNSLFFSTSNAGYSSSHPASVTNETLFMVFTSTFNGSGYVVGATGSGGREAGTYVNWTRFGNINAVTEWAAITPNGSMTGGVRNLAVSTISSGNATAVAVNAGTFTTYTLANPVGSNARTSTLGVEVTNPTFSGHMHEIIAYTRVLSTSERQAVEGYLAWKWGIRNNYATTHPYYKFRP